MIACMDRRILVILLFQSVIVYKCCATELNAELVEGKQRYDDFRKISTYGSCWKSAFLALDVGCGHLTDEIHSRLALDFANCFLENSGSKTCDCLRESTVRDCLKKADDRIFSTYRDFYIHTRSICNFWRHQVWQENTGDTIKVLSGNLEKVSQQLEKSGKLQQEMLHLQKERSRQGSKEVIEEFKSTKDEQRCIIFVVFDYIRKLVLDSSNRRLASQLCTILYYGLALSMCNVLTSAYQTSSCRSELYYIASLNYLAERVIIFHTIDEESAEKDLLIVECPIYYHIWVWRTVCGVVSLSLLGWTWYKNYDKINKRLQSQKEQVEMKSVMQNIRSSQDMGNVETNGVDDVNNFSKNADGMDIEQDDIQDLQLPHLRDQRLD